MKNCSAALAILLATAMPALASEPGPFIGLDYGHTSIADSDFGGNGFGAYAGYRLNESLAFEVGYRHLLDDAISAFGTTVHLKATAVQASVIGYLPLGHDFTLMGRLGYNRLKAKASGAGGSASESEGRALFGIGVEYAVSPSIALRLEVQKPASDTRVVALGAKFSFWSPRS